MDDIERALAPRQVFFDQEGIEGGQDWAKRIAHEVRTVDVVLALIGTGC